MELPVLPDLCLLRILSHLPPRDLLSRIPLVCRAWRRLAGEACRRTHSLALIVGNEANIHHLTHNYLHWNRLGATTEPRFQRIQTRAFRIRILHVAWCKRLTETFPNVSCLEILLGSVLAEPIPLFVAIQKLLNQWASRLIRFGFWFPYSASGVRAWSQAVEAFVKRLNRLSHLRILTLWSGLWMNRQIQPYEMIPEVVPKCLRLEHFDLAIMKQLEQLDVTIPCRRATFLHALLTHGLERGPGRITLTNPIDVIRVVDYLIETKHAHQIPVLAGKIPHLRIQLSANIAPVQCLGRHFRNLQSLEILYGENDGNVRIRDLSGPLSQLTQLRTLNLRYHILNLSEEENPEAPRWYPLASVRAFILEPVHPYTSHAWIRRELNPTVLLPNLEYVYINGEFLLLGCRACNRGEITKANGKWIHTAGGAAPNRTARECLRAVLEPFRGCSGLRHRLLTSYRLPNNVELEDRDWRWAHGDTLHPWW